MKESSMELYISICREMGLEPHAKKPEAIYKYYCYAHGQAYIHDDPHEIAKFNFKEKFVSNQEEIDNWDYNKRVLTNKVHDKWKNRIRISYQMDRDVFETFYEPLCTILSFDINCTESQAKLCIALKILLDSVAKNLVIRSITNGGR
jgi:hypothetical protein